MQAVPVEPLGVMGGGAQAGANPIDSGRACNPLFIGLLQPHNCWFCSIFHSCCSCPGSRAAGMFDKWIERFV